MLPDKARYSAWRMTYSDHRTRSIVIAAWWEILESVPECFQGVMGDSSRWVDRSFGVRDGNGGRGCRLKAWSKVVGGKFRGAPGGVATG